MLNYTKDYALILSDELRKIKLVINIVCELLTFVFPIVAIVLKIGNYYFNIFLIATIIPYIIAMISEIYYFRKGKKNQKIQKTYRIFNLVKKSIFLLINIYSIYISSVNVNGIAIIVSVFNILLWLISFIVTVAIDYGYPRYIKMLKCVKKDLKTPGKISNYIYNYADDYMNLDSLEDLDQKELDKIRDKALEIEAKGQQKVGKEFKKQNLDDFLLKVDKNKDREITSKEVIEAIFKDKKTRVNKENFLHREKFDNKNSKVRNFYKFKKEGPSSITISVDDLNKLISDKIDNDSRVLKNKERIINYKNKKQANLLTDNDVKDAILALYELIPYMQKILYLYGYNQIDYISIDDNNIETLEYALKYIINYEDRKKYTKLIMDSKIFEVTVSKKLGKLILDMGVNKGNQIINETIQKTDKLLSTGKEKVVGLKDKLFHKKDKTKEIETTNQELLK